MSPRRPPVFSLVLALLAACGTEAPSGSAPARGTSPLESAFSSAAREYQVPEGLLKSMAWVETRVDPAAGRSNRGAVGVMQLVEQADWHTLSRAAALTGHSADQLAQDPTASIRGAAAVLRELFDAHRREDPSLNPHEPGDWYRAVAVFPGLDDATASATWAADVYACVARGFTVQGEGGTVVLTPGAADWRRHAPATVRESGLGDYPGNFQYVQSPNYTAGRAGTAIDTVIVHTMQGSYAGTLSWFKNTSAQASSQYILRSSDGQVTQMVADADTAWHAQCYNKRSIGLEHEGYINAPATWYTDAMYTESAKLTKWLCDRHGIPKDRTHIIGHNEVPASCNTNSHTDPGSGWNWTKYMGLITGGGGGTGGGTGTQTGTLTGVIYEGGNTNSRVAGATVTAGGQSVTTPADGSFTFTLPVGSQTATVTKAGYTSNTVTRTVAANATIWGSMEINPAAATGTLTGKVYAYNAANPTDTSQAIAGATIQAGTQSLTSDAQGAFSATLPAGTYTLVVSKTGYANAQVTKTVTAGGSTRADVGLSTTGGVQPPSVAVVFPADGAALDFSAVQVRGTASDDSGPIATVSFSLNGGAAYDVPVTGGQFSNDLVLRPGANSVLVSATDADGRTASTTVTLSFNAGVAGLVFVQGEPTSRVGGATVELIKSGTTTRLGAATTDAAGAYFVASPEVGMDAVLVVKAPGYLTNAQTVTVPADQRLAVDVGLVAGSGTPDAPTLTFSEPMDGSTLTTDTVTVYGTVSGFDLAAVKLGSVQGVLLGAGGFTATVPLVEGRNVIEAVATGVDNQSVTGRLTVTRVVPGREGQAPEMVTGGCGGCSASQGSSGGLLLLALGALLRRRR